MSETTSPYMKDNITGALEGVKRLINFYVATLGLYALVWMCRRSWVDRPDDGEPLVILGITAHEQYVSLVYAVLFLAFSYVLFRRIGLLMFTVQKYQDELCKPSNGDLITMFPWLASPFHQSKSGIRDFWFVILIGLAFLGYVAVMHYAAPCMTFPNRISRIMFRWSIGSSATISFVTSLVVLCMAHKYIREIRKTLGLSGK